MNEFSLSSEDARAIVRLLGEVCVLPDEHEGKKRHLMEGLCDLVDADYWAWVQAAELEPGKFPVYVGFLSGRFSEALLAEFLQIQAHSEMIRWTIPLATELRASGRHVTRNVQDQFDYEEFLSSEVGQWWSRAGIEPRCIAFRPLQDGSATGIGLYRKTGRALFCDREARIMHILLTEVPWLHEMGWPEDRCATIPDLSRRCWLVHEMLLQGFNRDSISSHLGLSRHTVDDYVKEVYRHLGVRSQSELIARFHRGDGADRP
jgi:DNA-binding CsgD family transcriptional regulator